MENLTIKELAAYLPYELKCQYEGIVNGSEISKQRREFQKENTPFTNWDFFEPINEIKGLKIAPLKSIISHKKSWVATCGVYNTGQKKFYKGIGLKPILHPLSSLTKEITINGEIVKVIDYISLTKKDSQLTMKRVENNQSLDSLAYWKIERLLELKFDIFNLIERGLAIEVTETFNPYK